MKPELLLPVGNPETFYAAIEGGADAIYLGVQNFNARSRAKNFTFAQLDSICKIAKEKKVKVFVTLNTLIKNKEIPELLKTVNILNQIKPDAIITQDLGVYYILNKYYKKLAIHASTQMGAHNSVCVNYFDSLGYERTILARELTFEELAKISKKTKTELEVFIHGALCYSFSGYCLFSSYLGGMSANRGSCRQPCRRKYNTGNSSPYLFNLKDLNSSELIEKFIKLGISSLKIEGRMKSSEYVFSTAKAYRAILDSPNKLEEAQDILNNDMGRQKTTYFLGNDVSKAISESPYTGIRIGEVERIKGNKVYFAPSEPLELKNKIRILPKSGENTDAIKIGNLFKFNGETIEAAQPNQQVYIEVQTKDISSGDSIFLIGKSNKKFNSKLPSGKPRRFKNLRNLSEVTRNIRFKENKDKLRRQQLYIRLDSIQWLKKVFFDKFDGIFVKLTKDELSKIDFSKPILRKNIRKIHIELPKFIPENDLGFYKSKIDQLLSDGVVNFVISHISQKALFGRKINLTSNENVYAMNDAAISFLKKSGIHDIVYPLENDFDNLISGSYKNGIIPMFFKPELFYSRMPVKSDKELKDISKEYTKYVRDGFTIIVPQQPVCITKHRNKMLDKGFNKFLLDVSYIKPSTSKLNLILKAYYNSQVINPSSLFNYKKGLS